MILHTIIEMLLIGSVFAAVGGLIGAYIWFIGTKDHRR